MFGRAEADAKRIVQCVNALSKNGPVAELVEMVLNIGWTKPNPLAFIDVLSLEEMREKANRLRQLIEGGDDD